MEPICSRVKELRLVLKLTQEEFAARLRVRRGAIANYEIGRNPPTDSVKALIYREFSVSPEWLEQGVGEMFVHDAEFSIDTFAKNHGATDLELRIVKAFFSVDQDTRNVFLEQFQRFLAEKEKSQEVPKTPAEMTESEIHAHALEIERQMLLEKRAAEESSASTPDAIDA